MHMEKMLMALSCLLTSDYGNTPFYLNSHQLLQVNNSIRSCGDTNLDGIVEVVKNMKEEKLKRLRIIEDTVIRLSADLRKLEELQRQQTCGTDATVRSVRLTVAAAPTRLLCISNKYGKNWLWIGNLACRGTENFFKFYTNLSSAFGDLTNQRNAFFIGLEKLRTVTSAAPHEALVLWIDSKGWEHYAYSPHFTIQNKGNEILVSSLIGDFDMKSVWVGKGPE